MPAYKVEVRAIYTAPGATPNQQRINTRNADYNDAVQQSTTRTHYTVAGQPYSEEYIGRFGQPGDEESFSRYGTLGWRCALFILARQDGDTIGQAVATRLNASGMQPGSKVQVFEVLVDSPTPFATGELVFEQNW